MNEFNEGQDPDEFFFSILDRIDELEDNLYSIGPLGIRWPKETVKKMLIDKGYKILVLKSPDPELEEPTTIALKPDQNLPDYGTPEMWDSEIMTIFDKEISDFIYSLWKKLL